MAQEKKYTMEFRTESIKEFNSCCDTTLIWSMTFAEAVKNIEEANNNYFYVSMAKGDVLEAINNEKEIADQLELDLVYINELGIYIALQP